MSIDKKSYVLDSYNLSAGETKQITFVTNNPNTAFIRNTTNGNIKASLNSNPKVNPELTIGSGAIQSIVKPLPFRQLYIYAESAGVVFVESFFTEDVKPADIPETQQVIFVNDQPITLGNIGKIEQPLPEGTNNIGKVDIDKAPALQVTTPQIVNISCPSANAEYSTPLPTGCKKFAISEQSMDDTNIISMYFSSGAGSVYKFNGAVEYSESDLNLTGKTLYFKNTVASKTIQVLTWV